MFHDVPSPGASRLRFRPGAQLGGGQLRRHGLHPSAAAEGPDAAADGGRGLGAPVAPGPGAQRLGALDGPGGWDWCRSPPKKSGGLEGWPKFWGGLVFGRISDVLSLSVSEREDTWAVGSVSARTKCKNAVSGVLFNLDKIRSKKDKSLQRTILWCYSASRWCETLSYSLCVCINSKLRK